VVVAARHTPGPPSSRDDGEDDEDEGTEAHSREEDTMDMTDGGLEEEPIYAKTSRAPKKKAWPVGSNGLRKKRVMKTREYKDAKGYLRKYCASHVKPFLTNPAGSEDYSDYESVSSASEEPPEAGKQKKATKKAKEEMKPQVKKEETTVELPKQQSAPAKSKKPTTLAAGGRKKTLDSFFAKK
jgi:DNA polymerase delta subunit 3